MISCPPFQTKPMPGMVRNFQQSSPNPCHSSDLITDNVLSGWVSRGFPRRLTNPIYWVVSATPVGRHLGSHYAVPYKAWRVKIVFAKQPPDFPRVTFSFTFSPEDYG
jgi:hypothetical protein